MTEDGILLRKRAEEIVALVDKTEKELRAEDEALCGEIAIGGVPDTFILTTATALRRHHPEVRFRFFSGDATDICYRLETICHSLTCCQTISSNVEKTVST